MTNALRSALKKLRLSGLLEGLEVRLQEAAGHGLSHLEFLELILQDELAVRSDRQLQRRVKAALFRELKPLDQFDWAFNPSVKKKQVLDLATCRFVREKRDVLWLGPPGVGKSFLVQAVGYQAIKAGHAVLYRSVFDVVRDFLHDEALSAEDKVLSKYLKPDLLIVDDMGMKQLPKRSGEYLFEIIMRRYETRSTMMTSTGPWRTGASCWATSPRRPRSWTGSCITRRSSRSPAGATDCGAGRVRHRIRPRIQTSQSAPRLGGRQVGFKKQPKHPPAPREPERRASEPVRASAGRPGRGRTEAASGGKRRPADA